MEASSTILSSQFPPRAQLKRFPPPTALLLQEQAALTLAPTITTSLAPQHSTSVILHELRDDFKPLLHINKTPQAVLDGMHMETEFFANEDNDPVETEKYLQEFQRQLIHWQGLWYLSPSLQMGRIPSLSATKKSLKSNTKRLMDVDTSDVVVLAKKALSASKQAVSLAMDHQSFEAGIDESLIPSLGSTPRVKQNRVVKSTRLLERRSKKRRVAKGQVLVQETSNSKKADLQRSKIKATDPDDALRLFSWVPDTKQLLTAMEESELIGHIQELIRLEEVKGHLRVQFGREPTLVEWAEAVGLSSRALKLQLHNSSNSREKLIYANFRLVVHIAKQYQGRGLNLHDLLQEGSMGLMVSVHKFKPQVGSRFATYAFWWIRQAVRKAIFQHSRTIRLPENVYSLLNKVTEAKRQCIREGHHSPTKEQIAARAGLTVDKLERLLYSARTPISMQQPVWTDQNTTFQQITADTTVETPKSSVEKQLMRRHVRNLLSVLSPRERTIMRLRYGIEDGVAKSLSEIGAIFGLSKERIRQLENRSLYKLRQRLGSEGLDAYEDLLIKS